ncbi:hypothetical protein LTR86_006402 [Recurvomyces mirabilis]|nr:hypothetical protein LTR86_006402 [Recurvomyces mirabilis]
MKSPRWLQIPFLGGTGRKVRNGLNPRDVQSKKKDHDEHASRVVGGTLSSSGPLTKEQSHGTDLSEQKTEGDGNLTEEETRVRFAKNDAEDIVQDYNAPKRWWVVATLFPLVAGTFGPMASAFNICAVAVPWRVIVSPISTQAEGPHIPDPNWLIGINALSIAIAITANLALMSHMTKHVRFNVSAPITIVGWFISGVIDIAIVAAAPAHVPLPTTGYGTATWSQAYYYAIFSGFIYISLSFMLAFTAYSLWHKQISASFKLTLAQRSLMVHTTLFMGYILGTAAIYRQIEGWLYLDCVYFAVVTLFTIGFGDFAPETTVGRGLFLPFALGGIVFVGLIIANIRGLVLESASLKVSTRLVEKARTQAIKRGDPENGVLKIRGYKRRDLIASTELESREREFNAMREVQKVAARNDKALALLRATTAFLMLWFVGAVCLWEAEASTGGDDWTYFETIYFTYVAQITVGYGDFHPQTNSTKPAFVFWALLALPTLTVLIGAVGDAVTDAVNWFSLWIPKIAPKVTFLARKIAQRPTKVQECIREASEDQTTTNVGAFQDIADSEKGDMGSDDAEKNAFGDMSSGSSNKAYRSYIIARAAQKVMEHVDERPPRKYTYTEWTWLLKLLGEDEADESGHRRVGLSTGKGIEVGLPPLQGKHQQWSWMGQESPLMDLKDGSEPKWVLKRLLRVLEHNAKKQGDESAGRQAHRGGISHKGSDAVLPMPGRFPGSGTIDGFEPSSDKG